MTVQIGGAGIVWPHHFFGGMTDDIEDAPDDDEPVIDDEDPPIEPVPADGTPEDDVPAALFEPENGTVVEDPASETPAGVEPT